jgi:hypothetical protein
VVGFNLEVASKFRHKGKADAEGLLGFVASILDGTAEQDYKSAPVPEELYEDHVAVVVGDNFDKVVLDPTKDVLLEAYAPWCVPVCRGYCWSLGLVGGKGSACWRRAARGLPAKMRLSV